MSITIPPSVNLTTAIAPRDSRQTVGQPFSDKARMVCRDVDVHYADSQAIFGVSLDIGENEVIAMIGPSGCGKSTFLRCLNRMNDTIDICQVKGRIELDGQDIYDKGIDVVPLRAQVGMVFQKPNPFPKSIYENIAYGPRIHGLASHRGDIDEIAATIVKEKNLLQVSDEGEILQMVQDIIAANPDQVAQFKDGKTKLMGFFVGQLMKASKGKANPKMANQLFGKELAK